jgi:hypothetical protein
VDMHATDLVGINGITRVLLVYTRQQCVYPRDHVLSLRLPWILNRHLYFLNIKKRIIRNYLVSANEVTKQSKHFHAANDSS